MYGIYSARSHKFVFGIQEPSKRKAMRSLFSRIGKDAYKWRFEVRKLPQIRCNCGSLLSGVVKGGITVYNCVDCRAQIISRADRIKSQGTKSDLRGF